MYFVYIIKSEKTNRYYIGATQNIEERLVRHNNGSNRSTKKDRPWSLVFYESCEDRLQAFRREKQIKSYKGGNAFKRLISGLDV